MKKGRMFYKIFIPILVLGIGLVISFGSYIYLTTIHSVIDRVADSKKSLITQIKNTLEQKIKTIEYAFNTYSTTNSFREVIKNPITERDFEAYRDINSQLNYIASMGMDGVEYSLISLVKDWQISNGRLSYLTEDGKKKLSASYIGNQSKSLFWIKTDTGIRFVNTLPVFSQKKQAIALSDISLLSLQHTLQTEENTPVYLLNRQGDLLYESESAPGLSGAQLSRITETAGSVSQTGSVVLEKVKHQEVTAIYAKSSYNNWIYVTLLDEQEIADALKTTRFGLFLMVLVITLLIVIVAYVIAVYFNKPIQKIQRRLSGSTQPVLKNEIDWIISSIDNILLEKESLEDLLESELPQLETQFILNLFHSRITAEELDHNMSRFGYSLAQGTVYATMLIQLDNYGERQASDKDLLLVAVNRLVEELIPDSRRMIPILLNDRTQATILIFEDGSGPGSRKQVLEDAKRIVTTVRDILKLSVSVGISDFYADLTFSKEACEMSKQALHHRLNLGKESIIFYEDISRVISGPVLLHYPAELESQLFDAIRLGDEEKVSRALYPLLGEIMKHSKNPLNFEVMLIRFVNNLIQLEQLIGVEVLLTEDNYALYHRLLDIRNPEEIERILVKEVIQPMVAAMKEKTTRQFRGLSDQIANIVRTEYDQDLSLELIGERLHYSPNYLSSIFKKEFGMTFSEYVMGYRLQMAKKWLVETEMTIKEIAERLQYHNPQNFIRSFRKKEHVTPGAYRALRQDK
ncbi:AraC family transcriptional regulator [Paenibacillus jilunlii]|uniref:AraC family transcriptional regulator n=1 Tax=Paenibacillus jilunlii TaxID=682956 RepID=A0A1G9FZ89_9BACL|nr:AraC family transcriptional regulator [Paenibacillus jilunlii]KWX71287.1 AraC family transcriptional regulator [Paenibacillus jilunlii]SDK93731.1 transcriptional regulator, AraC family [Paenibacillus jilunlii]